MVNKNAFNEAKITFTHIYIQTHIDTNYNLVDVL